MTNDIPRRIRHDLMTKEELAIYDMVGEVEKLGAHPLLTDTVVLLGQARSKLADWVDLQVLEQIKNEPIEPLEFIKDIRDIMADGDNLTPEALIVDIVKMLNKYLAGVE